MQATGRHVYPRRSILLGMGAATGLLLLPGAALARDAGSTDGVRRLLRLSTRNAFARLTAPDGFWNSSVARIELPVLFGRKGAAMPGVLGNTKFRDELQHRLNVVAEAGARRVAPMVTRAVRRLPVSDGAAVIAGGPTAATSLLRQQVGADLVNALIPAMRDALRAANDPQVAQAIAALRGVDLAQVGHALALNADSAIWYEIGNMETEIRRDPAAGGDAVLAAMLKSAPAAP